MKIKILSVVLSLVTFNAGAVADGVLNTAGFNAGASGITFGGSVPGMWYIATSASYPNNQGGYSIALQGAKFILAGNYRTGGANYAVMIRLNSNGTTDGTFGSGGTVELANEAGTNIFQSIVVQSDNKPVVGGGMTISGVRRFTVIRRNATTGASDSANFNASASGNYSGSIAGWWSVVGGLFTTDSSCQSVALQPSDGKILAAGFLGDGSSVAKLGIVRLNTNGTLDTSFTPASGVPGIWYAGGTADDQTYLQADTAALGNRAICVQSNNRIVVAARFKTSDGLYRAGVMRLMSDGTLDTDFNPAPGNATFGGTVPGFYCLSAASGDFSTGAAYSVAQSPAGDLIVSGSVQYDGVACPFVMRLTSAGVLDTTFNTGGESGGYGGTTSGFWILTAGGSSIFTSGGSATQAGIDPCNRVVFTATASNGSNKILAVRLTSAGKLDTTFNPSPGTGDPYGGVIPGIWYFSTNNTGAFTGSNHLSSGLLIPRNNQVLLACYPMITTNRMAAVSLISKNGLLQDTASPFSGGLAGLILTTTIDQNGKIVVGGNYSTDSQLTRYTTAGARDTFGNFGGVSLGTLTATAAINKVINTDLGYLVAGVSSTNKFTTAAYTTGGFLNSAYGAGTGIVQETAVGASAAYDMLVNGTALSVSGFTNTNVPTVINYESSLGTRNSAIGNNGLQKFSNLGTGIIYGIQTTTSALRYGAGQGTSSNTAFVRLLADQTGMLQDTAAPYNTSAVGLLTTTTIDQAGKLVVGGLYGSNATAARYLIATNPARDTSFGGAATGAILLTSLATTSSLNKIINAASNTYLATGQANNQFTTLKLTSVGVLDTAAFNSPNGFVTESGVGASQGYDMLLNGAALAVAGVTNTNSPSIINYNSATGARDTTVGVNGLQQFPLFGTGIIYGLNITTGTNKYAAGQADSTAFVRALLNGTGLFQDNTLAPFDTAANGLILTTTIDQTGKLVVAGYYGTNAMAARYNVASSPIRDSTFDSDGALLLTSLATTSSLNKIVNADTGYLAAGQSNNQLASVKITSAGALDTTYNSVGYVVETGLGNSTGVSVVVNLDGTLVVSGQSTVSSVLLPTLVAYTATGGRLTTFGSGGVQTYGATFGAGILNDIIAPRTGKLTTAGQMGSVATLMQVGQSSSLFDELNNGF